MMAEAEILKPGLFSSIQDFGRRGFMSYGVPVSGSMDTYAAGLANLLLENPSDSAILEITQMGPTIQFTAPTEIVLTGALLSPAINGEQINNNKLYPIGSRDILSFGRREVGCRSYLGIKNGFKTEKVLGSRSWCRGISTFSRLEKGMKLEYEKREGDQFLKKNTSLKTGDYLTSVEVEVFEGPEYNLLSTGQQEQLQKKLFSVGMENDRMGIQLQEELANELQSILTGPVLPGTVQLTPSGKVIILMRDGQTTGGYPRILQLSEKGINTLSQKLPGEQIRFLLRDIEK